MRNDHIVFCNGCAVLHSHQQCVIVAFSPHSHQCFSLVFLIIAILKCVTWYLIVVLTCIFLMISGTEPFSYTYWPFVSILCKNSYSDSLYIFKLHFFFLSFLLLSCTPSFYTLDINPLPDMRALSSFFRLTFQFTDCFLYYTEGYLVVFFFLIF